MRGGYQKVEDKHLFKQVIKGKIIQWESELFEVVTLPQETVRGKILKYKPSQTRIIIKLFGLDFFSKQL